jgi:small-conductance mechanosensitive channel
MKSQIGICLRIVGVLATAVALCGSVWAQRPARSVSAGAVQPLAPNDIPSDATLARTIEDSAATQLSVSIHKLLNQYRDSNDDQARTKAADDLAKSVGQQFDALEKIRGGELDRLEARLKQLRERHEQRLREKDSIVQERVRQLLRHTEGLGWEGETDADDPFGAATYAPADDLSSSDAAGAIKVPSPYGGDYFDEPAAR